MSENLPARVKFFRDSIQQIIDSRAEPSYDMLRSLLVEDERLAEWERRTGTAPQEAQADPKSGTWDEKDEAYLQAVAPVPQTEGEQKTCPKCDAWVKTLAEPCWLCRWDGQPETEGECTADAACSR